jgi:hypothetical protein
LSGNADSVLDEGHPNCPVGHSGSGGREQSANGGIGIGDTINRARRKASENTQIVIAHRASRRAHTKVRFF